MTEPKVAIEIKNVSKQFILPQNRNSTLKQAIISIFKGHKNKKTMHQVLKDINFNINDGDFFGIIGRNGSGKSSRNQR